MYLVDTNVVAELRKGARVNLGVKSFFEEINAGEIFLAVQTIGEIRRGIENIRARGDARQAKRLEQWLNELLALHTRRILPFDHESAQVWGKLMSPQPHHPIDKQIAAIAHIYNLTVVTRNTADFASCGVVLINPFS